MGGNVEAIKERLDIAEVIGGYIKLEKAGANFKAKCPFHNEKTASFFISPSRQSYYCFGCGAKGDIFTFVEEMEGADFKGALKTLADRAGVELKYEKREGQTDIDKLHEVLHVAMQFYEEELKKNKEALQYLKSRGVNDESIVSWRLGFAPQEWRSLRSHLHNLGFTDEILGKAGLVKRSEDHKDKEPYDTFRGRIIFPLFNPRGEVIAFSGRALAKDTEPKYLNSPDTVLFTKSDVLYGLDKAREDIRRKDYAVLVEGQLDLVLSHQAGVGNTVASSGTAFTQAHLERLKRISPRIVLAFDGDLAGMKASEKSATLALALGMEVKIARLFEGKDPADLVQEDPEKWKEVLRNSKSAIEVFLEEAIKNEKDPRKIGKTIEKKLLPLIALVGSSMERSHFVSLISKRTGIREDVIVEDLRQVKLSHNIQKTEEGPVEKKKEKRTRKDELAEVTVWLKENPEDLELARNVAELKKLIRIDELDEEINELRLKTQGRGNEIFERIVALTKERDEVKRQDQ